MNLPHSDRAFNILQKVSSDPAILYVMTTNCLSVTLLTELDPQEHPGPKLLGLNIDSGRAIKLCLRMNRSGSFRPYTDIRHTLCHELCHNRWGEHDDNVCSFLTDSPFSHL